ncbi:MAG: BON domain-containing protein [Acidobacteria bacterium]|nr:BON domain-containing protein [Acidobacteriota bacterium]
MFKKFLFSFLFSLCFLGLTTSGAFAQTATNIPRSQIDREIRKEILSLPYYGVFDAIGYKLDDGSVSLNGYVTRPYTKREAEEYIKDIDGVTAVENNIKVLPVYSSDNRIRVKVYRAIANQPGLYRYLLGSAPSIRIIVNHGYVSLEGFVTFESDKTLAGIAAREIFGVINVENNLKVDKTGDMMPL